MLNCFFVGLGGFVGSILRYLISLIPVKEGTVFPIQTFVINIIGAFCIGLIVSLFSKYTTLDQRWLLFLKVGLCGGFTTFSTFSMESLNLFQTNHIFLAILYIFLSVVLCIAAVFAGQCIIK